MTKPGYKTKAFWLTTAAMATAVVMALGYAPEGLNPGPAGKAVGLLAAMLAAAGYAVRRSLVKKGDPTKPAWRQTEFWLSCAALLVGSLLASGAFAADGTVYKALGVAASMLALLGYGQSQAVQKPRPAPAADIIEGDLR